MIASLPMYIASPNEDKDEFWQGLAGWLRRVGVAEVPDELTWPEDFLAHWQQPDLLLSQTCGYSLTQQLAGQVQLVGNFCYAAEGCSGPYYRSLLIARVDDRARNLEDFRGRSVAYNASNSQSGYNALRALIAPLAVKGQFFGERIESGSHLHSIQLVEAGVADLAAIDCVSFALVRRSHPELLRGIKVLGQTAAAPGLPLITNIDTSPQQLALLRQGLNAAEHDPELAVARAALLIVGFEVLPLAAFHVIREMKQLALNLGYSEL